MRGNLLQIRISDEEKARLKELAGKQELATWARETLLRQGKEEVREEIKKELPSWMLPIGENPHLKGMTGLIKGNGVNEEEIREMEKLEGK